MQQRRPLRLVAGALVLALPLLASCGFDKATNKVYTPAAGTNNRDGQVDVLAAVVVAGQPDSGTFIASLSNNSTTEDDSFTGVQGSGEWSDLTVGEVSSGIDLPARGFVNLADGDGVPVSGDFGAGDVVELTLTFDSGQSTTMDVPVVFACDAYEGLDTAGGSDTGASPTGSSDTPSPGDVPTDGTTPSPSETSSSSSSSESASASAGSGDRYDCTSVLEEG
jgi:hypothetical protein